ncbi:MAG: fibronectin type III domain-containing protein, partial [Bacteroidia bacterium]|nr:fibronectin type III domain-containing protein [Bacteroidia bacterium]
VAFLDAIPDTIKTQLLNQSNVPLTSFADSVTVYENLAPGFYRVQARGRVGQTIYPYPNTIEIKAFIPTTIDSVVPGTTTAAVTWTAQAAATGYQLRYRRLSPSASGWITVTLGPVTSVTLTSLTPNAAYQIQVRGRCANGTYTLYLGLTNFSTNPLPRLAGPEAENLSASFNLYPNPNRGSFSVTALLDDDAQGEITMTDMAGRVVHRQAVDFGKGENVVPVNVSVASGLYTVQIRAGVLSRSVRVSIE